MGKRILHLVPDFQTGGTEQVIKQLEAEQLKRGHIVCVLGFNDPPGPTFAQFKTAVATNENQFHLSVFKKNKIAKNLEAYILHFKPDIVHSHSAWTDLAVATISPKIPFKQVCHFHLNYDFYLPKSVKASTLASRLGRLHFFYRQSLRNTQYISVSDDTANYYSRALPKFTKRKQYILENPCKLKIGNPRTKVNLRERPIKAIAIGRLEPIKNFQLLIQVVESALRDFSLELSLQIYGEGPEKENLIKMAEQKGVSSHVKFCGYADDIGSKIASSDIFLHAALHEPFGLVTIEAMSQGVPCIVNERLPASKKILSYGEAGILESISDPKYFANAIKNLVENPSRYEQYSEAAVLRASDFTIDPYIEKLEEIYGRMLD